MSVLNPIWLWALGGLTIPIVIHLLSRKEGKTIRLGSIRFLTETSTSKFSSIRLNEIVLLATRCLLVVLLALFLANLLFAANNQRPSKKWVVVEKGLEDNEQIKKLLDSLKNDRFELHRLSKGFPLPGEDTVTQSPDYYKLSEELAQKNNTQSLVIARNTLSNFKGKRIALPDNVTWLSYPAGSEKASPDEPVVYRDTVQVTLAYQPEFNDDARILRAALHAIEDAGLAKFLVVEIASNKFESPKPGWLIWLSADNLDYAGTSLQFKETSTDDLIIQESKNRWLLTKRLDEGNAVEQHLAVQLLSMFFSESTRQEISRQDKRTVSDELAWATGTNAGSINIPKTGQSADKILALMIALLFTIERVLAFYRKQ